MRIHIFWLIFPDLLLPVKIIQTKLIKKRFHDPNLQRPNCSLRVAGEDPGADLLPLVTLLRCKKLVSGGSDGGDHLLISSISPRDICYSLTFCIFNKILGPGTAERLERRPRPEPGAIDNLIDMIKTKGLSFEPEFSTVRVVPKLFNYPMKVLKF